MQGSVSLISELPGNCTIIIKGMHRDKKYFEWYKSLGWFFTNMDTDLKQFYAEVEVTEDGQELVHDAMEETDAVVVDESIAEPAEPAERPASKSESEPHYS